jgi:hypothetical protein
VQSTYDERYYTTELNKSGLTREQVMRAEKLSKELGATNDEPVGDDEEASFSAVRGTGRYTQPEPSPIRTILDAYYATW